MKKQFSVFKNSSSLKYTVLSAFLATSSYSCKKRSFNNESGSNSVKQVGGGCKVEVKKSVEQIFQDSTDLFKLKLLANADCGTIEKNIPKADVILKAAGCARRGRSIVSESAPFKDIANSGLEPRFVDTWDCAGQDNTFDRIFIAGPGPGDAFHIIAADPNSGGYNFYSGNGGTEGADFVFHGNSFNMGRISEYGALNSTKFPQHPCTTCHQNGGPILKELRFPWMNWAARTKGSSQALLPSVIERRTADGGPFLEVEELERDILKATVRLNTFRVRKIKEGANINAPLAHSETASPVSIGMMLQPILCQNEVNLATSVSKVGVFTKIKVPPDLFLNRLLYVEADKQPFQLITAQQSRLDMTGNSDIEDFGQFSGAVKVPLTKDETGAAGWQEQLAANGAKLPIEGKLGSDGQFPMLIPVRSFSDDDYSSRLVTEAVLKEKFVQDLLMIDYQNPVFSKTRCDLLNKDLFSKSAAGLNADQLQSAFEQSLNQSFEGTKQYNANKSKTAAQHATLISRYVKSCADNIPKKIGTLFMFTQNKLANLKNPDKNVPMFAVEGFVRDKIFPISALQPAALNVRLKAANHVKDLSDDENCSLEKF